MGSTGKSENPGADTPTSTGAAAGGTGDEVSLSWQERELVSALRRLANARSQLLKLEEEAAAAARAPSVTPAGAAALTANHAELQAAQARADSRFGRSARRRVLELDAVERKLLAQNRLDSYDAFLAWQAGPKSDTVDLALLDFARREVASAAAAVAQIQSLELPEIDLTDEATAGAEEEAAPGGEGVVRPFVHPEAS
jgi:hypothetical protein